MEITRRMPSSLGSLRQQLEQFLNAFHGDENTAFTGGDWLPAVDEVETPEEVVIKAELPGIDEKDISVSLSGDTLTIHGEKRSEKEQKDKHFHRVERSYGKFERRLPIPASVDPEKITADYTKGVLEVHLPKTADGQPRKIDVKAR
jgi:HSP20 family protein